MVNIGNDWDEILKEEFNKEYYLKLREFLKEEYEKYNVFPPAKDIFNALRYSSYENTKVVIIGQDPYHEIGQAHGLCFSVNKGVPIPPSLKNIYKEIYNDLKIVEPNHGYLMEWAKQGVLLLNATLTVRQGEPMSHKNKGWEILTDKIIEKLNEREKPMVFILWGNNAKEKESIITNSNHLILKGSHPSPLSAHHGFFNYGYFSKANNYLRLTNQDEINWKLND